MRLCLSSTGYPGNRCVDQAGLNFTQICLPLPTVCWDSRLVLQQLLLNCHKQLPHQTLGIIARKICAQKLHWQWFCWEIRFTVLKQFLLLLPQHKYMRTLTGALSLWCSQAIWNVFVVRINNYDGCIQRMELYMETKHDIAIYNKITISTSTILREISQSRTIYIMWFFYR